MPKPRTTLPANSMSQTLAQFFGYYQQAMETSPCLSYLTGTLHIRRDIVSRFQLGYAAGDAVGRLPTDGTMLAHLKTLGVITANGQEYFKNHLVFGLSDLRDTLVNLWGTDLKTLNVWQMKISSTVRGWSKVVSSTQVVLRIGCHAS